MITTTTTWLSLAMASPPADGAANGGGGSMVMIGYMAIFLLLLYFMMIRPQARREKERRAMLSRVKSGDRVIFGGGMIGIVANAKETTLVIKIADNVKVEVIRGAVTRVIEKDEAIGEETAS